MATKNYMINDKWLDINKKNIVELQSVDGVLDSVKLNGEEYGGGGSSDFSTAEVTVTNNGEFPMAFGGSFIVDNSIMAGAFVSENTTETLTVVLYKGVSVVGVDDEVTAVVTGDITYSNMDFTITGDGTITIS